MNHLNQVRNELSGAHKWSNKAGFTLIELLVVISIISMLSSVVLASLQGVRERAQLAAGQQFSGQIFRSMGDDAILHLGFDTMSSITLAQIQGDQKGEQPITNFLVSGATLSDDLTLYRRGKHLSIPSGASHPFRVHLAVSDTMRSREYTMAGWYQPSTMTSAALRPLIGWGANVEYAGILLTNSDTAGNIGSITVRIPTAGSYYTSIQIPASLKAGIWYHIAVSVKATSVTSVNYAVFLNGKEIYRNSISSLAASTVTDERIFIGGYCCGMSTSGLLDDLAIFRRTLLATDIQQLYANGVAEHGLAVETSLSPYNN